MSNHRSGCAVVTALIVLAVAITALAAAYNAGLSNR